MSETMEFKNFYGSVQYDAESEILWGKIEWINDLVTFEAEDVNGIKKAFQEAVDDYIDICERHGKEPEKAFKGSFNVRVSPDTHRFAAITSRKIGITLNQFVETAIVEKLSKEKSNMEHNQMIDKLSTIENSVSSMNQKLWANTSVTLLTNKLISKGVSINE